MSNYYIQISILTFELGRNIEFWHFKSYLDIRTGTEYRILTFDILFWHANWGPNIEFWHSKSFLTFELGPNLEFWHSKSYFDIRTWAEYRILTFEILILTFEVGRISNFDIRNLFFLHSSWDGISNFDIQKSYFDIRTWAEYRILTFEILFWHSNWGPYIEFCHSKSYFGTEFRIMTFKFLFWHSS